MGEARKVGGRQLIKHIEETLTNCASNSTYTYGIEFDGEIVGDISLRNLQEVAIDPPEIGYWISKDYAGKGLTTLATQALTSFGLRELGMKEIVIRAETGNTGSNKIAEKSGYVFAKQTKGEDNRAINVWSYRGGN